MAYFGRRSRLAAKIIGIPVVLAALLLAIGIQLPAGELTPKAADKLPTVIDDVTVIDPRTGTAQAHQIVVINGNRIRYAGPADQAPVVAQARRIAGAGKFLTPGLWDAHVHTLKLSPQLHFPTMLANGVTGLRDMGDGCSWSGDLHCKPEVRAWRERIAGGTMLAPRLAATASYHVEQIGDSDSADAAAITHASSELVAALKARGDDLVKLQLDDHVDPAQFESIVAQANLQDMRIAGHLPFSVDLLNPRLGKLHSVEHDTGLLPQCSTLGAQFDGRNRSKASVLAKFDERRCDAVLDLLAKRGTAYTPTHIASIGQDWTLLSGAYREDARVNYVVAPQRWMWRAFAYMAVRGTKDEHHATLRAYNEASLRLTHRAQKAGVTVLAGTDSMDPYVVHGFGLHDELGQLALAGLTPAEALRAATWNPVRHFGFERDFGTIEAGKMADMLLLNANPLDDIRHLQTMDTLIYDGKTYSRQELDAMLRFVEQQASSFGAASKFVWGMIRPW